MSCVTFLLFTICPASAAATLTDIRAHHKNVLNIHHPSHQHATKVQVIASALMLPWHYRHWSVRSREGGHVTMHAAAFLTLYTSLTLITISNSRTALRVLHVVTYTHFRTLRLFDFLYPGKRR
jgi:hypothetical protein